VLLRSGIALLLATAIAALTPSFAAAAGVAYPDAKWSQAWIDSPSRAGDATLHADVLRPKACSRSP
jgi:hypothetical protein